MVWSALYRTSGTIRDLLLLKTPGTIGLLGLSRAMKRGQIMKTGRKLLALLLCLLMMLSLCGSVFAQQGDTPQENPETGISAGQNDANGLGEDTSPPTIDSPPAGDPPPAAKAAPAQTYAVTIASPIEHGTVTADKTEGLSEGDLVTLTIEPETEYELESLTVKDGSQNPVKMETGATSFKMPASNVSVEAAFKPSDSSPPALGSPPAAKGAPAQSYTVTISPTIEHGTLTADPTEGLSKNDFVALTIEPEAGYELETLSVKDGDQNLVAMEKDGTTFKMPASNVSVDATFKLSDAAPPELDPMAGSRGGPLLQGNGDTLISSIAITGVTPPAVGNAASTTGISTSTAGISLTPGWIVRDGETVIAFADGETFAAGKQYGIRVVCQTEATYAFDAAVAATVNSETAAVENLTVSQCDVVYWFAPLAGGVTPGEGQILIPFAKTWSGTGDSEASRPASITVTLYKYLGTFNQATAILVETATITAADLWKYTFDISNEPLYYGTTYSEDTIYKFKIVEGPVAGYAETVHIDPNVVFTPPALLGGWDRVTPCSVLNITTGGNYKSIVVAKKGHDYVVWSVDPLSEAERLLIYNSALSIPGMGNPSYSQFTFLSGYGVCGTFGMTITETQIIFDDPSSWSLFGVGLYSKSSAATNASAITNTRDTYGNLTVTKTLAGNAPDANKDFSFTVTLSDTSINGTYGGMSFTNGVATFVLKGGESKTATGLPSGLGYTVTEASYTLDGYETTHTGATGNIIEDATQTAAFTNRRDAFGNLLVSKTLAGNDTDSTKVFTFTIDMNNTNMNCIISGVEFINGVATITLRGGESKLIEGLPNGAAYTVTETDYTADGYTTTYTGETGTIVENTTSTAAFTNTRNTYGSLTVTKTLAGNAPDANKDFSFTVTLSDTSISGTYGDMTFTAGVATFTLKGGESAMAENLPNGVTYTVTEADYGAEGYETTHTGDTGTVAGGSQHTAAFTNKRDAFGSLLVSKTLAGNDTDSTKPFTFTIDMNNPNMNCIISGVEFVNGIATITLRGGESKLIEDLPNGAAYTVTETDYTADGYTTTYTGATGTIVENTTSTAAFTNTRNTYGSLTVTKTLAGNAPDPNMDFSFTVTLSDTSISGVYGDMTFNAGVAAFTLKGGESATAENLPNGVTYTVTETAADGYETTYTGRTGSIVGGGTQTAAFTNTRDAYGDLTIRKLLAGNATDPNKPFTFTITLSDTSINASFSGVTFTNGVATITLKGGESRVIRYLPHGVGYTVAEDNYSGEGYTTTQTGETGTINENTPATAVFTNTRNTYGNLTVTKTLAGNAPDPNKDFSFTVTLSDTSISGVYGDMNFTNGVATFTLKGDESATATGLPNGVTYTVTEANYASDGYVTTHTGEIGTIVGGSTQTAAFTNTRNAAGSLTVSKFLAGNDFDSNKSFTFTITLSDTSINDTFSGVTFTNGVATITLKDHESKTIEGIPNGTGYTVTEADYSGEGYVTTNTGNTATINEHTPSVVAFTNTRNTYGNLTVEKILAGVSPDPNKEFSFTVTLSDASINGAYGDMTFINGVATFVLKGGESKTATGLPNGVSYTVTEADYLADDYVTTKTGDEGTITGNITQTATFTNTRRAFGDLKISKILAGNDTDSTKSFTFEIDLHDTSINCAFSGIAFTNGVATITLKGGESKLLEGIPHGLNYTVTETDYSGEGYGTTYSGSTGTINETVLSEAVFTNTRNTYGTLEVTKTVAGNAGSTSKEFSFTVTLSDNTITGAYGDMTFSAGVATFVLKHGESKKAAGLPNGVGYTVTEASYALDGYVTTYTGRTGTIVGGSDHVAAFTNTRDAYGDLTIRKILAGNDTDSTKDFTFTITLNQSINGTYSNVTFTNGVATITLKGGESKTIRNLPNGVGYTVDETDYSGEGYGTTYSGSTGTIDETTPSEAVFTNTRNTYGTLEVTKTVAGNAGSTSKEFSFTVTLSDNTINGNYGGMDFTNGVATFILKHGESKKATGLPNGVSYTVTEASYVLDGYVTTYTGRTGTIVGGSDHVAAFTNTRDAYGDLTIRKILAGNDTDSTKDFTFIITLNQPINGTYSNVTFTNGVATITLKGGESKAIRNLPHGVGYTVDETDYSGEGYGTTPSSLSESGTIDETTPSEAVFTNTRNTYGDLTVTKTIAGNAPDASKDFSFTVTLSDNTITGVYGDMTFNAGIATFSLKGGESARAVDLPNGVHYTVTEENYTSDGYITTSTGATGTIVGNDEKTAAFTNTRDAYGNLIVWKRLDGNDTDSTKDFNFTVTLDDNTVNGTFGDVEFTNGVATFTLKGNETKSIRDLPNGMGYKVVEDDYSAEGYVTTKIRDEGTIIENASAVARFTNTRNTYGDLIVTKSIAGNAPSYSKEFSFTVRLSDNTITGVYGDMDFSAGVASFILKGGESKTATGLPNGVGYTVDEADYSADGYVTTSTGGTGSIVGDDELTAAFTNTRDVYGKLNISKKVCGDLAETDKYFAFTVTFDADGIYNYSGSKSGTISSGGTILLKHGESVTIHGLTAGTVYSVSESDNLGYRVFATGHKGVIRENETSFVIYMNCRSTALPTGDNSDIALWFGITVLSGMAMLGFALTERKRRRKAAHQK